MKTKLLLLTFFFMSVFVPLFGEIPDVAEEMEKSWSWRLIEGNVLAVTLHVPPGMYAYADATHPKFSPELKFSSKPVGEKYVDPLGDTRFVLSGPGAYTWEYPLKPTDFPLVMSGVFEGCDSLICFLPETTELAKFNAMDDIKDSLGHLPPGNKTQGESETVAPEGVMLPEYTIVRTAVGYKTPDEFISFLTDGSQTFAIDKSKSVFVMLLIALLGGLALNLTPCVLPLIPVNLAMIGAFGTDTRAGRIAGGLVYGGAIMIVFGTIGVIAAVTGGVFGAINSSWIFNIAAGVIFLALAVAMFGFVNLDFSNLNSKIRIPKTAGYAGIFAMGGLSALLAGACVAPVLVATLFYSASLYQQGNYVGLLMPFVLGAGMALPWPFLGAGLALMPKPGKWMVYVKYVLGALIAILGLYYIWTAFGILSLDKKGEVATAEKNLKIIAEALEESKATGKDVLLDFWATWCKNCTAMELNTLPNGEVKKELDKFIFRRIQTEVMTDPGTKVLLEEMNVKGLPTFVIIRPLQ